MNQPSQSEASKTLRGYLGHIEYWDPDGGDADLLLSGREWLEAHRDNLRADQQTALAQGDDRLLALAGAAVGNTQDVEFLRLTAKVVNASR
ncbi:hypothetical protein [uncultured Thiodictyon sp.]|uniref:hypothetical protein n=1 Tax=uncultured Thiodictyon sp. TaxID=1846217 RepID=UPI0025DE76A0|nr:hypothetical protein [uncultured Thiodictyon sp.]